MDNRTACKTGKQILSCLVVILFVYVAFFSQHVIAAEPKVVRICYYENPPKFFRDTRGIPRGIFPEIFEEIARTENRRLEWVPGTWQQGLENLESGVVDILPDVAYSLERAGRY